MLRFKKRILQNVFISIIGFFLFSSFKKELFKKKDSPKEVSSPEIIYKVMAMADFENKSFYIVPHQREERIIIKDSSVIVECTEVRERDSSGITTWIMRVKYYTYIDLRTKSFYKYQNFSDTATVFKKYIETNSADIDCGWAFWRNWHVLPKDFTGTMKDTTVNGVKYNLIRHEKDLVNKEGVNQHWIDLAYFLCDKKTIVQFDNESSKRFGCPLVRYDFSGPADSVQKKRIWISSQLEFSKEKLTEKELKVFDTWEKYAKEHPIK